MSLEFVEAVCDLVLVELIISIYSEKRFELVNIVLVRFNKQQTDLVKELVFVCLYA